MHLETGILRDATDVDEFDPWDLPEVHDFGPKWSGKIAVCFTVGCFFYPMVDIPVFNFVCTK